MVTQFDIAKKLGVSRQLVSFALAGYPQVSAQSRERILEQAKAMGYKPNPHARALREGKTGIVALWIPNQISSHYTRVTRDLSRLLKQEGVELIVSEVSTTEASRTLSHVPVDGMFVVDSPDAVAGGKEIPGLAGGKPVVCMGGGKSNILADSVQVDLLEGARMATRHLIESGARRIAHMTFVRGGDNETERRTGYLETIKAAGLKPEFIYYPLTDFQRPIVRSLIQDHIRKHGKPDALFCHSDDVAIGAYRGLSDMGLKVPEDVLLVGCDGIPDTEYLETPITTLSQPVELMCVTAWQFFKSRQGAPDQAPQHAVFPPVLTIRRSSQR